MYRSYDLDLAELSHNENVGRLPFSPLARDLQNGIYQGKQKPPGSCMTISPDLNGHVAENSLAATDAYVVIAQKKQARPITNGHRLLQPTPLPNLVDHRRYFYRTLYRTIGHTRSLSLIRF